MVSCGTIHPSQISSAVSRVNSVARAHARGSSEISRGSSKGARAYSEGAREGAQGARPGAQRGARASFQGGSEGTARGVAEGSEGLEPIPRGALPTLAHPRPTLAQRLARTLGGRGARRAQRRRKMQGKRPRPGKETAGGPSKRAGASATALAAAFKFAVGYSTLEPPADAATKPMTKGDLTVCAAASSGAACTAVI